MISLGSNISSLKAQRKLADGAAALSKTFERLSSGSRINSASDDAAGLAIAANLNSDKRVFTQAIRNVNDGISMLDIAQGALTELSTISIRHKELAEQAANGTFSLTQRKSMNAEANALVDEFNRIVSTTEFNGVKLLDNSNQSTRIQAGYGIDGSLAFGLGDELSRNVGDGTYTQITTAGGYSFIMNGGIYPNQMQLSDVNNDGKLDIVGLQYNTPSITVMLGNGDGTFQTAVSSVLGLTGANFTSTINIVDLNNDGKLDITGSREIAGDTFVMLGNGNGTFQTARTYALITSRGGTVGDFNNDGNMDLATTFFTYTNVAFGNGDGTFRATISSAINIPYSGLGDKVADFNGDGNLDIITATRNGGTRGTSILLGNGNGTFTLGQTFAGPDYDLEVADFNHDGYMDFAAASEINDRFSIYLNDGKGTFTAAATITLAGGGYAALAGGDMNGDGHYDILAIDGSNITLTLNNGDGTFQAAKTFSFASANIATGDIDGDGALDIVSGNISNFLHVFKANTDEVGSIAYIDLLSRGNALSAMNVVDQTLNRIQGELAAIGAFQSRLGTTLSNLAVARQNFESAESRITDTDVANESAELTKRTILQQAAVSVLAQANQQPALALSLLR